MCVYVCLVLGCLVATFESVHDCDLDGTLYSVDPGTEDPGTRDLGIRIGIHCNVQMFVQLAIVCWLRKAITCSTFLTAYALS